MSFLESWGVYLCPAYYSDPLSLEVGDNSEVLNLTVIELPRGLRQISYLNVKVLTPLWVRTQIKSNGLKDSRSMQTRYQCPMVDVLALILVST